METRIAKENLISYCYASYLPSDTKYRKPFYEFNSILSITVSEPDEKGRRIVCYGEGCPTIESAREIYLEFKNFSSGIIFPKTIEEIHQEIKKTYGSMMSPVASEDINEISFIDINYSLLFYLES